MPSTSPVFLIGLPRSGTTLLAALLGNHPLVAAPPEPWAMLALHQLGAVGFSHPADSQVLGSAFRGFAPQPVMRAAARAAADVLYDACRARTGRSVVVDKTPRYWMILDFLKALYPEARFLWLRRNPLDVAASLRTRWGVDLPRLLAEGQATSHVFDYTLGPLALGRFHAEAKVACAGLRYEDLVTSPVAWLRAALVHIGVAPPDDPATLLSLDLSGWPDDSPGDRSIRTTRGPHAESVGRWHNVFTPAELQTLRIACGDDVLTAFGYGETVAALDAIGMRADAGATGRIREQVAAGYAKRWKDLADTTTHGAAVAFARIV